MNDAAEFRQKWTAPRGLSRTQWQVALRQANGTLKYAIRAKANSICDYMLTIPGLDVNKRDPEGVNVFWHACAAKNLHVLRKMLEPSRSGKSPADVTAQHEDIGNALHCCTQTLFATGATEILKATREGKLLDYTEEADGRLVAAGVLSPEWYLNEPREDGLTPLGVAVVENSLLMV